MLVRFSFFSVEKHICLVCKSFDHCWLCSSLSFQEENLLDILGLAHRFGFVELEGAISDYLKAILNSRNVCFIYDLANMYNLTSLCQVCKEYIDRNAFEILHSEPFLTLSQVCIIWCVIAANITTWRWDNLWNGKWSLWICHYLAMLNVCWVTR